MHSKRVALTRNNLAGLNSFVSVEKRFVCLCSEPLVAPLPRCDLLRSLCGQSTSVRAWQTLLAPREKNFPTVPA